MLCGVMWFKESGHIAIFIFVTFNHNLYCVCPRSLLIILILRLCLSFRQTSDDLHHRNVIDASKYQQLMWLLV